MKKFLVVGLGNIGEEYIGTRHNIGFEILDFLAEKEEITFSPGRLGDVAQFKHKGRTAICLKPSTYMNLSGKAVLYWLQQENIPLENLLVLTDDLNLPFGSLRLKTKGSDGGHNGLKDIQKMLGTAAYPRLRFGVGADYSKGHQVDYVLGKWNEEEAEQLNERLERCHNLIKSFLFAGPKNTMNNFNNT